MGTERLYEEDESKQLNVPWNVPANEFLNLEGRAMSGSRNWAVWVDDFLTRYDPDPLRYYLTVIAPETRDTDFAWSGFLRRNNDELVATWGNLANRVLSFAYKNFDASVPVPDLMEQRDAAILAKIDAAFDPIAKLYESCKFKAALNETMALARDVNVYLDAKAPWFQIKEDKQAASTTVFVALRAIDSLKTLFAPVLPFTGQQLHEMLGHKGSIFGEQRIQEYQETAKSHLALTFNPDALTECWEPSQLQAGQALQKPRPLFKKLDDSIVEQELARMG
jgi:methionyl-tRNA synthetase